MAETDILLESGTNEVEILEFLLEGQPFGLNVHKVTAIEIFEPTRLTPLPETPPEIMGSLLFRDSTIPLIDASQVIGKESQENNDRPLVVTVEFNNFVCGLYVDGVNRIHRINWEQFEPLDMSFGRDLSFGHENMSVLGSIHVQDRDILILDIESIGARLFDGLSMEEIDDDHFDEDGIEESEETVAERRAKVPIMVAEDSPMIRCHMVQILQHAGYTNISVHENGKKALEHIEKMAAEGKDWVGRRLRLLVTDIEMPEMDGLTLCRRVKEMAGDRHLPVIMFSSLINQQMAQKCKSVGGDAWISKPQIGQLADTIDNFTIFSGKEAREPALV